MSESEEQAGVWVGFAEYCGDSLTHMVLDVDTQKIIYRRAIRLELSRIMMIYSSSEHLLVTRDL